MPNTPTLFYYSKQLRSIPQLLLSSALLQPQDIHTPLHPCDNIFICLLSKKTQHYPQAKLYLCSPLKIAKRVITFRIQMNAWLPKLSNDLLFKEPCRYGQDCFQQNQIRIYQLQQISNRGKQGLFRFKRGGFGSGQGQSRLGRGGRGSQGEPSPKSSFNLPQIYNIFNMELGQPKSLQEILTYKAQFVTGSRFLLLYIAVYLFPSHPQTAAALMMASVILDYIDGIVARKYNQVSYFGEIFDWITDTASYAVVLFWWNGLEPSLILAFFTLFSLQVVMMMVDTVSKCHGYTPKLTADKASTFILHYTMDLSQKGYKCSGLGYWNMILHFLCMLSRILFLATGHQLWLYVFWLNVPASISYVWMHIAYSVNILERWNEETHNQEQIVKFIEK